MNYKFKLTNLEINIPDEEAVVRVGEFAVEVEGLNILEMIQMAKEVPAIVRELRYAIEMPIGAPIIHSGGHNDDDDGFFEEPQERADELEDDAEAMMERAMLDLLCCTTNMDPHHFIGGINEDLGYGMWDTQARKYIVTHLGAKPRRHKDYKYTCVANNATYKVYVCIMDDDDLEYAESIIERLAKESVTANG